MDVEVRQRVTLLTDLREAIEKEQLFLAYQPQVELKTESIIGLEALLRWRHPHLGIIPASKFIALAESSGLMIPLGHWVVLEACRQARRWRDAGLEVPVVAVNVSAMQIKGSTNLSEDIARVLRETGLPPDRLEVELTETSVMEAWQHRGDIVQEIRNQGIRIAIDDFGTGYSSLEYLRRFPACRIKIAQTFISDIMSDPSSGAITRATISLGRELGLTVIAEGVETAEQLRLLKLWGCNEVQGFLFAKPLPPDRIPDLLQNGLSATFLPSKQIHGMDSTSVSDIVGNYRQTPC